ncbi:hypothetical protein I553_7445 [Mycobacterium xenopi 4042]|uniref:Uncharacterized protein n=1 Tax=Mycobacterium xenopi 4042 TaxID=1299334 RepID=X8E9A1_MYCXE|nr:hypothetical protein I553_7445 [Mycobacterium xenopi 4042]
MAANSSAAARHRTTPSGCRWYAASNAVNWVTASYEEV